MCAAPMTALCNRSNCVCT